MEQLSKTSRDAAWRAELRASKNARERMAAERVAMPELEPDERIASPRSEVNRGLTPEMAATEASRCLDCPKPGCMEGCPVSIDIPGFIKEIERGDINAAASVLKATSALPAVCGRVCPQEKQCESRCIYNKSGRKPVAIGYLERFAADNGTSSTSATPAHLGIKVAAIGSGPAGLSFAGSMAALGYDVTVFEALHEIGGVLKYGIPEFRLPNSVVDTEINRLRQMGVTFVSDCIVGKTITIEQLESEGYAGIFAGSGAGLPRFMEIPGENLSGVMSCNEYLTRVNLMGAGRDGFDTPVERGKRVAVIGGGNTAMDAVRTARRMGADEAIVVYRRSDAEMPARAEEVHHARQEGVTFMTLHNPVEYLGDERGHVRAMRVQRMQLGEPDASGRRSPVPVPGDITEIPVDLVIVAVGVSPNPILPSSIEGLDITRRGTIAVSDDTMASNRPGLYAGGDIVRGGATVILAMGDGRRAALAMHQSLTEHK